MATEIRGGFSVAKGKPAPTVEKNKSEEEYIFEGIMQDYPDMEGIDPDEVYDAVREADFPEIKDENEYRQVLREAYLPQGFKSKEKNTFLADTMKGITESVTAAPAAIGQALGSMGMEKPREEMESIGYSDLTARGYTPEVAQNVMKQRIGTQQELAGIEQATGEEGARLGVEGAASYISAGAGFGTDPVLGKLLAKKGLQTLVRHATSGAIGVSSYNTIKAIAEDKPAGEIFNQAVQGLGWGAATGALLPPVFQNVIAKPIKAAWNGATRYLEKVGSSKSMAMTKALSTQADVFAESFKSDWMRTRYNADPMMNDPSISPNTVAASIVHAVLGDDVAQNASESAIAKIAEKIRGWRQIQKDLAMSSGGQFMPPEEMPSMMPGMMTPAGKPLIVPKFVAVGNVVMREGDPTQAVKAQFATPEEAVAFAAAQNTNLSPRDAVDNILIIQREMQSLAPTLPFEGEGGIGPMPNALDTGNPTPGVEPTPQFNAPTGQMPVDPAVNQNALGFVPPAAPQAQLESIAPTAQQRIGKGPILGPIERGGRPEAPPQEIHPRKLPEKNKRIVSGRDQVKDSDLPPEGGQGAKKEPTPKKTPPSKIPSKEQKEMKKQLDDALDKLSKKKDAEPKPITEKQRETVTDKLPEKIKKEFTKEEIDKLIDKAKDIFDEEQQLHFKYSSKYGLDMKEVDPGRLPPVYFDKELPSSYSRSFTHKKERIVINPKQVKRLKGEKASTEDQVKFTLGHEIGHATGSKSRLERRSLKNYRPPQDKEMRGMNRAAILEEAIADAVGEALAGVKRQINPPYPSVKRKSEQKYVAKKVAEALLQARDMLLDTPLGE